VYGTVNASPDSSGVQQKWLLVAGGLLLVVVLVSRLLS
jgi:hypothetical protein